MYEAAITLILEKKEYTINGENKTYYEATDYDLGMICDFSNTGKQYVSLNKNKGMHISYEYNSESKYALANCKTFYELAKKNNNHYDLSKFIKEYKSYIGMYAYYDKFDGRFKTITDENVLQHIKNINNKDYDGNILDNKSDISHMYSEIKKTIISQDEQIMQILTSLFKNQKVINSSLNIDMISKLKENLIIYGSTGTGKTEILKRIAKIYKVPLVIEDATSLSETGFVGRNITDMLEDLYLAAGKDIELAQKGILVIDEFDKLAEKPNSTTDHVSRIGVQRSLLKLMDGTTFYFNDKKFDTSKLSVVALGAFTGITDGDDYSKITSKNFVDYGIMRELMGRFSKLVSMNSLSKDDIKKILLESDFSPLNTYKQLFETMNIDFDYDDEFIDYIAERAVNLKSGARSLKTIFDDVIGGALFRIFAGEYSSIHLQKPKNNDRAYTLTKK